MLPIWFQNAKLWIYPIHDSHQLFLDLVYLSDRVMQWIDTTRISESVDSISAAKELKMWFFEFCDWTQLSANPARAEHVEKCRVVAVRLHNLVESF